MALYAHVDPLNLTTCIPKYDPSFASLLCLSATWKKKRAWPKDAILKQNARVFPLLANQ